MAVSRVKTFVANDQATAAEMNTEFDNILTNGEDLAFPATKAKDFDAQELILDADGDTSITADTDDRIDFRAGGTDVVQMDATAVTNINSNLLLNSVDVFAGPILATEQATTSGTEIDFTSIPAWVKRITLQLNSVQTNGTSGLMVQIGDSGGIETSGYLGSAVDADATPVVSTETAGYRLVVTGHDNAIFHGSIVLTLEDAAGFTWVSVGQLARSDVGMVMISAGRKSLGNLLTQIRLTTVGGSEAFDGGAVNIIYE